MLAAAPGKYLLVDPPSAVPGAAVVVHGGGFAPGAALHLSARASGQAPLRLRAVKPQPDGSFCTTITVPGAQTAPATIERAMEFYSSIGKRPIHIRREVAGHVANRLQAALWREAVHLLAGGVASVADIDTAITEGPGLRWALMGPHLTFHLAGGSGGMAHFLEQLGPPLECWWDDLGSPRLTPEVRAALADGVAAEAGGRDIATLAADRDRFLVDLLALKAAPRL